MVGKSMIKKCTGRFDLTIGQFATELHKECFGCKRKSIREDSSKIGWFASPHALFKDDKCLERLNNEKS